MMMARIGYNREIPVVNYFPPTAWSWGRWRARWLARTEATVAAVFLWNEMFIEKWERM